MMKNYFLEILGKIYKKIFGGEITPRIRSFIRDLQIVAIGTGIGNFLGLIFQDKKELFNKISKLIPYVITAGLPFILICEFIILKFYGKQYYLNLLWLILFAVASIFVVIDGLYGWFFNSIGNQGVKLISFAGGVLALVNISLNFILIPLIGIPAAMGSIIISFAICITIELLLGRKYLR
jgi:O-antigen/teichoic acid export membrane protein